MNDIIITIKALRGLRSLNAASNDEIVEAEKQLNLHFSDEFKQYMAEFGAIYSETIELKGIAKTPGYNVVAFTTMVREACPNIPKNFYAISETGYNGVVICQDGNGFVYEWKPNDEVACVASSLNEYINSKVSRGV